MTQDSHSYTPGTIFVDAMGGDNAPICVIGGLRLLKDHEVTSKLVLLGDEAVLAPFLRKIKNINPDKLSIHHCSEVIAMDESPVQSVRSKKCSSIVKGLEITSQTANSAFFSAGHSGAVMAAALLKLGRIKGVDRPAIATPLPTITGQCILIDAGANVECRPEHLVDSARMGSTYAQILLKIEKPRVAILSNGEEESKGTELTRASAQLLKELPDVNFLGYVEGKEIFNGKVDVVVTDGFTGNIVLKSLEGLGKAIFTLFKDEFKKSILAKMGAAVMYPILGPSINRLKKKLDYAEVGSAPLLGVDGNCFIGHGRSGPKAIKNGILRAQVAIQSELHRKLVHQFSTVVK